MTSEESLRSSEQPNALYGSLRASVTRYVRASYSLRREVDDQTRVEKVRPLIIDDEGAPVTIAPRTWFVCFVPGLRRQWWHRFVLSKHKHVFALHRNADGRWTLFEPWWSRLLVATVTTEGAIPFLRWGMLGEILEVREDVPGAGSQMRGWMNCAALTAFMLGRSYWVWSPSALYRRLSSEPDVARVDMGSVLYSHFEDVSSRALGACLIPRFEPDSEAGVVRTLESFGCTFVSALFSEPLLGAYRSAVAESAHLPEVGRGFLRGRTGHATSRLIEILSTANRLGLLRIEDSERAAAQFLGLLRADLHLQVVLGLRPAPSSGEIDRHVKSAVELFLHGVRTDVGRVGKGADGDISE
jgi:AefR-like transcriptional repressor, C-terminal domain